MRAKAGGHRRPWTVTVRSVSARVSCVVQWHRERVGDDVILE
jgi:hypothetical protein